GPAVWRALLGLGALVAGAAVWFLTLQAFVLRRLCLYCVIAHAAALCAAAPFLPGTIAMRDRFAMTGLGVAFVMALVQVLFPPELSAFTATPAVASESESIVPLAAPSPPAPSPLSPPPPAPPPPADPLHVAPTQ